MNLQPEFLDILVVDDDKEVLSQLKELLPSEIDESSVEWDYVDNFDVAIQKLRRRRYDLLISDIYRDRAGTQKNIGEGNIRARDLVDEVREKRFCPIILFTDGQVPENLVERPFLWVCDKSGSTDEHLVALIREAIKTGLPAVSRALHDELDGFGGSYVWRFLAERWEDLHERHSLDVDMLAKIIRRRAAIQFGRLDQDGPDGVMERANGDPVDYYIYPPTGPHLRLGEIVRRKATNEVRVVLTPHCFLTVQAGESQPRASHVLTVKTETAEDLRGAWKWQNNDQGISDDLRRRTGFPAGKLTPPEGRYCFLPGFLDIPDLYCDLMQLESVDHRTLTEDFDRLAVLDAPYAEALQAGVSRFYGAVGVPNLNQERVRHLGPKVPQEGPQ